MTIQMNNMNVEIRNNNQQQHIIRSRRRRCFLWINDLASVVVEKYQIEMCERENTAKHIFNEKQEIKQSTY